MKTNILLMIMCGIILLWGCYEDKGHYDYSENNGITIDLRSTKYTQVVGEVLTIEPIFTFALDSNETGLEYNWMVEGRFLSDKRDLSYEVDTIIPNGNIRLRVLDTKSGITYLQNVSITFLEKHDSYGWMLLSDNNNESYLTFIQQRSLAEDTYIPFEDVYKLENKVSLGTGPIGILEHFYKTGSTSNFWVLQKDGGGVDIEGRTMRKDVTLSETFLNPDFVSTIEPKEIIEMGFLSALVDNNGKIYTRRKASDKSFHTNKFLDTPLKYDGKELNVKHCVYTPTFASHYTLILEGEQGSQRFLALTDFSQATSGKVLPLIVNSYPTESTTRLDNLKDMELLHVGYYRQSSSLSNGQFGYLAVLKSPAGEYFLENFKIAPMSTDKTVTVQSVTQDPFKIDFLMDGTNLFYVVPYYESKYVLITKGNELYYIDYTAVKNDVPQLLCRFDANITVLDAESTRSKRLGVGLANGEFHVLTLEEIKKDYKEQIIWSTKTQGKIVDVRYRMKRGNGWS